MAALAVPQLSRVSGVAPVATEAKIPTPTPAPQAPWKPQDPPGTASERRRASPSQRAFSPGVPRALAAAVSSAAGTRKWCSGPWSLRPGWRIRLVASATGSVEALARQARSITSRAGAAWQPSQTKWPAAQDTGLSPALPQRAQVTAAALDR